MTRLTMRSDARANRERVLLAATAILAERGADAEMREIAERAGVAVGTLYSHFPGKHELIAAVLDEARAEFNAALAAAEAPGDPIEAVRVFLHGSLAIMERYGALMAALQDGRLLVNHDLNAVRERRAAYQERVAALIQRGIDAGALRPDLDRYVAGALVRAMLTPWSYAELRRQRTPDEIVDGVLAILLDGARAPG
jgi:AcrR family transcriptional regulator